MMGVSDGFGEDYFSFSGYIEEMLEDDNEASRPYKVDQRVDRIDLQFFD